MAYKGFFKPKNRKKYLGNSSNIIYRSRWELRLMSWLDDNPNIVEWASEEFFIRYLSPVDNKYHRYFPDFWVKKKNREGKVDIVVVEVKPLKETKEPRRPKKLTKSYLYEAKTWAVNKAKWEAARAYCDGRGWKFQIVTERELNLDKF